MTAGIIVGLVLGVVYAVSLRRSLARAVAFPLRDAVRLVRFGSLMRLLFAVAALSFATRAFPGLNAGWALLAAVVAATVMLHRMARRGAQA